MEGEDVHKRTQTRVIFALEKGLRGLPYLFNGEKQNAFVLASLQLSYKKSWHQPMKGSFREDTQPCCLKIPVPGWMGWTLPMSVPLMGYILEQFLLGHPC